MRFVSVRSVGALIIVFALVGAAVAVGPPAKDGNPGGDVAVTASDASGNYQRLRSGVQSGWFSYSAWSSDASGYYSANGSFNAVEDDERPGKFAYQVSWFCYDPVAGSQYAYGIAPASAVTMRGKTLQVDFDTAAMLEVGNSSGPVAWTGTFMPFETGSGSNSTIVHGNQVSRSEYAHCTTERRFSGTTTDVTANFTGMCGSVFVPEPLPNSNPNGRLNTLHGTGHISWSCLY